MSKVTKDMIRRSAAEYPTFVAASGEGGVEAIYADENVWLSQKMMGTLYNANVRTANDHLKKVFEDNELEENSVIRNFRITAAAELAKEYAETEFKKYRIVQDRLFASAFDGFLEQGGERE